MANTLAVETKFRLTFCSLMARLIASSARSLLTSERAEDAINLAIRLKNVSTASVLAMKLLIVLWRFFAVFVKIPLI